VSTITFKHWKTGEEITIRYREVDWVHNDERSDRIVVFNEDTGKYEDILKETIVDISE